MKFQTKPCTAELKENTDMKIKTDSDLTMAVNDTFNAIINEIQLSKLNFLVNVTPFAAYITIKKTTILDRDGSQAFPTPPSFELLEDMRRDKLSAEVEIGLLKEALLKSENQCKFLTHEIETLRNSSEEFEAEITSIKKKNHINEVEISKINTEKKKLKVDLSASEKKLSEHIYNPEQEVYGLKKMIKSREKEAYNLNSKFDNAQETIKNLKFDLATYKSSKTQMEKDIRKCEQKK